MIRVLFVCLGNICRSPMAEAVFQHLVDEAGLSDQFHIDSAGTGDWHVGEMAHIGTRTVLRKHHIHYDGRARQFKSHDWSAFDYILAMDESNLRDIMRLKPSHAHAEAKLFLSYANADKATSVTEVPDPYYTGKYDQTYDLVLIGAKSLLASLRKKHGI